VQEGPAFAAEVDRPTPGAVVVRATGELDLMTVPQLEAVFQHAMADKADIELDLSRLDFIDSTGVHLVLTVYDTSVRDGFEFVITGATADVRRAFELLGLLDHLPFRDQPRSAS
jgi:anti-sigma B factor antagonist